MQNAFTLRYLRYLMFKSFFPRVDESSTVLTAKCHRRWQKTSAQRGRLLRYLGGPDAAAGLGSRAF